MTSSHLTLNNLIFIPRITTNHNNLTHILTMSKRIQSFFAPVSDSKRRKPTNDTPPPSSHHPTYPFAITDLPSHIADPLANLAAKTAPRAITDQPDLDLLYFQPLIPAPLARQLFEFLRDELPFYRVQYSIRRGPTPTQITTPRFTSVFGVDESAYFVAGEPPSEPSSTLVDRTTNKPVSSTRYQRPPRPLPACLDALRRAVQAADPDAAAYNFCLVNYYADGGDSITYHSDDERFLGSRPSIASLSLGASRDFLLKHKPGSQAADRPPTKMLLAPGDLLVMRGDTQANWLHSIPKRKGPLPGRINVTFRRAIVPAGTDNYYRYNVGDGPVYRWSRAGQEMVKMGSVGGETT